MSVTRHYFPGNNTPEGFFSYYRYILDQREAEKIICIKGGPGTGKSTFLRAVGERLAERGEDIDFLQCSADRDSLDGILIKNKNIAFIDGTSPHIIDPVTPGAVDSIINFGDFWNDEAIGTRKEEIISGGENCSRWYRIAYNHLAAAKKMADSLEQLHEEAMEISEIYKVAADIIAREYKMYDISMKPGRVRKFFATGITPAGMISHINTLIRPMKKIYLINVPEGYPNTSFMQILMEGAIYRGFDVESFYCPMDPARKIEHLLIPALELAFVTTNRWHDPEPWELAGEDEEKEITMIDICDYEKVCFMERHRAVMEELSGLYAMLIDEAVQALAKAKESHDGVEKLYVQSMNFEKINSLIEKTVANIV